jgi:hypothetical protein
MESGPSASSSPFPLPAGSHWSRNRLDLLTWFRRNAPSLGELYEGAVEMLFKNSMPGRARFIAHAVREIGNRLPDVIAGSKSASRFEWKQQLDGLTEAWQKAGLSLDGSLPVTMAGSRTASDSRSSDVTLPRSLYLKVTEVLYEHSQTRETRRSVAIRLFEGSVPENKQLRETLGPIVRQWMEITEWFVKSVHDSGIPDNGNDWGEFIRRFHLFEDTLTALVGKFFTTIEGLDEILDEANT